MDQQFLPLAATQPSQDGNSDWVRCCLQGAGPCRIYELPGATLVDKGQLPERGDLCLVGSRIHGTAFGRSPVMSDCSTRRAEDQSVIMVSSPTIRGLDCPLLCPPLFEALQSLQPCSANWLMEHPELRVMFNHPPWPRSSWNLLLWVGLDQVNQNTYSRESILENLLAGGPGCWHGNQPSL